LASASSVLRTLSERLKHHRGEKGWSQEELAERACIHRTYLAGIETARRNPSLRSVVELANALRVPVAALFTPLGPGE
jgi:transcriptional regulator with XRE-family HTH domain